MSATATTHDWYQTNVPPPPNDPTADPRPQWVRTIAQKLEVQVPVDMHLTRNYDDSGSEGSESGSEDEDGDLDLEGDFESLAEEGDANGSTAATVLDIPEIHPHRYRLHGLALSPGGGVTAVLVSTHSTQRPERGGWHTVRSSVLFGYKPRRKRQPGRGPDPGGQHDTGHPPPLPPIHPALMGGPSTTAVSVTTGQTALHYDHLTTEAKLFEYLYGGGPEVPGVHYPSPTTAAAAAARSADDDDSTAGAELREVFGPALAAQKCDLCGAAMDVRRGALSGCRNGHFFGTCATSGLAVQTPGATRSCGACGLRTMRAEVLLAKIPKQAGDGGDDRREKVRRLPGEGVCGACGGKFLS